MSVQHTIRDAHGGTVTVRLTPRTAIKRFCVECFGWERAEVPECSAPLCPLYPFRLGHVTTGRKQSERQRAATREGLKRYREQRENGPKTAQEPATHVETPPDGQGAEKRG